MKSLIRLNIAWTPLTGLTMALQSDIKAAMQWVNAEQTAGPLDLKQANLLLPVYSIHQKSKPENDAMYAGQMLTVRATKKAKPTRKLSNNQCQKSRIPKIDADICKICCHQILKIGPECQ